MPENRREFLTKLLYGLGGLGLAAGGLALGSRPASAANAPANLAWAEGKDVYKTTQNAILACGGMGRFVKKGQRVAVLPNVGWARTLEQGACTHPQVVKAIIDACDKAGAKSITVFCNPCDDMRVCLEKSGIGAVVEKSAGRFEYINEKGWRKVNAVKGCEHLKSAEVYRLIPDSDVLINCPVAKHHGGSTLTMCCKNLMGLVKDRGTMHQKLHTAIADLTMMVPQTLCVLDGSRILLRNGPTGGDLKDVAWKNTIIAGVNPVEVDAMGCKLFNMKPSDIGYLKILGSRGWGQIDTAKLKVQPA
jgi:uncharacterized protein (DUF362 family)